MQFYSRIVAMLLLLALAALSAGAEALALPAAHSAHSAGCHGHPSPAPPPPSHHCCIAGHNHAFPANLFSGLKLLPYFGPATNADQAEPDYRVDGGLPLLIFSLIGSPGSLSLRI